MDGSADRDRHVEPHFGHHPDLPVLIDSGVTVTVIMGELGGATAPARVYSPLVGVEVDLAAGGYTRVPLHTDWEYAALALSGTVEVDGLALSTVLLLYLGLGRSGLALRADQGGRVLLIGGELCSPPIDRQRCSARSSVRLPVVVRHAREPRC